MTTRPPGLISRPAAEIAAALATAALGATVLAGALEFGIGWTSTGPEAGTFPFVVGVLIVAASAVNAVQALRLRQGNERSFLERIEAGRVASFVVPMVLFLAASMLLGLYVGMALYLFGTMVFQGGYRPITAAAVGLATAAFFFLVLERWFQVPLLKGPLEAALRLH